MMTLLLLLFVIEVLLYLGDVLLFFFLLFSKGRKKGGNRVLGEVVKGWKPPKTVRKLTLIFPLSQIYFILYLFNNI